MTVTLAHPVMSLQLFHLNSALNGLINAVVASKAGGPDDIPNWVLPEFALELVQPVCSVLDTSFITGSMPET